MITKQELIDKVKRQSGHRGGWPNYFNYDIDSDNKIVISADISSLDKKAVRRLDPWGLAFLNDAKIECGLDIRGIKFVISVPDNELKADGRLVPNLEAFRRRVSFLSINNPNLHFAITLNTKPIALDDSKMLFQRPDTEVVRGYTKTKSVNSETEDNQEGRLEKDFQSWLCPKKQEGKATSTNARLAVLGFDFFNLKKAGFGILREFPTGVFLGKPPSEKNRVLPTEFVDIVTLNKHGSLAVIELKLNDPQLEVIAQLVDYSLFFRCYRDMIWSTISETLHPKNKYIICYVVNNHFHKRFDKVFECYSPNGSSHGFGIVKVILGYTPLEPESKSSNLGLNNDGILMLGDTKLGVRSVPTISLFKEIE